VKIFSILNDHAMSSGIC
jgi:hypothetical protein